MRDEKNQHEKNYAEIIIIDVVGQGPESGKTSPGGTESRPAKQGLCEGDKTISYRTLSSRTRSAVSCLRTREPIKNLARSYICVFKRLPMGGREMGGNKGEWAQEV